MINILLWVAVGLFIGWNFPQPAFAKSLQAKFIEPVVTWIKSKVSGS